MTDETRPDAGPSVPKPASRSRLMKGGVMAAAALSGVALVAGLSHLSPSAAVTLTAATASPSPGTGTHRGPGDHRGGPGGPGDRGEDQQAIATAIGISTTQLQSELSGGKTIAQVAQAHNVSVDKVISALVAEETKEIDSAVSAGKLTQAQATQLKSNLQQRVTDEVNGTGHGPGGPGGPRGHHGGLRAEDQQLVAQAIGITTAQLQSELSSGKTIAQVAQAHGVDVNTVLTAWVASETKEIDDPLAAGKLTQAQADQMKAGVQRRVTDEVNGAHPQRRMGGTPPSPPAL